MQRQTQEDGEKAFEKERKQKTTNASKSQHRVQPTQASISPLPFTHTTRLSVVGNVGITGSATPLIPCALTPERSQRRTSPTSQPPTPLVPPSDPRQPPPDQSNSHAQCYCWQRYTGTHSSMSTSPHRALIIMQTLHTHTLFTDTHTHTHTHTHSP